MRNAVTLADAVGMQTSDIFDLEGVYTLSLATTTRDGSRQGVFHPSGVGTCKLSQVYEYNRAPFINTIDPESLEIFDLGHAIHELVGKRFQNLRRIFDAKSLGYELSLEVKTDPETDRLLSDLGIDGTCDARLDIWANSWRQRSVVETKSINRKGFEELGTSPMIKHLMQAHLYAFRYECPIIYVWYYCKDNSKRRVYPCVFDPVVFQAATSYFEELLRHVEAGTLPPREEDFYACPRCKYREICKPEVLAKIQYQENNAALSALRTRGRL